MSFYVHGHAALKGKTLERALDLAENGQIAHALVMWKKHNDARGLCNCQDPVFDQVRCGFCFTGKLLMLDLLDGHKTRQVPYSRTADALRGHLRAKTADGGKRAPLPAVGRPPAQPQAYPRNA